MSDEDRMQLVEQARGLAFALATIDRRYDDAEVVAGLADAVEQLQVEARRRRGNTGELEDELQVLTNALRRAKVEHDRLVDRIQELQDRLVSGANKLEVMAEDLPHVEANVRPHVRLLAKAAGLRVALDYTRSLLDVGVDVGDRWTMTCSGCGETYDKSDDSRHECHE